LKVHLHHSSKIKSEKEIGGNKVFLAFLLVELRIRICTNNDGSGSRRPTTYGFGSRSTAQKSHKMYAK
jgi:hypothetical protein